MKNIITLFLICLVICSCSTIKYNTMVIAEGCESKYHIVLPAKPTENEQYAAQVLQEYMFKISGAKIPIVHECNKKHKEEICIGKTIRHPLSCDKDKTICVRKERKCLVFNAKDDKYTMYSVIDFMEKYLGVRQFATNAAHYPKDSVLQIKNFKDYEYTTPNSFRQVNSTLNVRDTNLCRWLKNDLYQNTFGSGFFVHTAAKLLSPYEYFETHPEYFALVNGQRSRDALCYSNKDIYPIVLENLKIAMALQPDRAWWSVSQNDNDTYCHCDKCQALMDKYGTAGAPIFLFVNKIAKEFQGLDKKTISTLAYTYSRKAPTNMTFEPNVQIMLCTIEEDRNKPIAETNSSFKQDLQDWGKITKNIFLWDYDVDFAYSVAPFPNLHVIQSNLQFFVENNATMHFQQANSAVGHEFAELKNYLISKLMWNPYDNQDSIVNEFLMGYYGKAGLKIKDYINDIEYQAIKYSDSVSLGIYQTPTWYKDNILSKQNIERYEQYFTDAENIAADDSIYLLRVRTARLSLDYAIMEIGKTEPFGERGWFYKKNNKYQVKQSMLDRLEKFNYICQKAGVEDLNESNLTPQDYYLATKRFTQIDITSDLAFGKEVTAKPLPSKLYCNGDLSVLTNAVQGADDYKMHWLGWWGEDVELLLDLDTIVNNKQITISTLDYWKAWILHPLQIECFVSKDNENYMSIGIVDCKGTNRNNPVTMNHNFIGKDISFRYVKFKINATKTLPYWHPSYLKPSWLFIDEIKVE